MGGHHRPATQNRTTEEKAAREREAEARRISNQIDDQLHAGEVVPKEERMVKVALSKPVSISSEVLVFVNCSTPLPGAEL